MITTYERQQLLDTLATHRKRPWRWVAHNSRRVPGLIQPDNNTQPWDPLGCSAAALELAVSLGLNISAPRLLYRPDHCSDTMYCGVSWYESYQEYWTSTTWLRSVYPDPLPHVRLTIVRAAITYYKKYT